MYRISVMYPAKEGARFDMDYYRKTHMPLVMDNLKSFGLDNTKGHIHAMLSHGHCCHGLLIEMEVQHVAVVRQAQDIGVGDDHTLQVRSIDQRQATAGSKRLFFFDIGYVHTEFRTVPKMVSDHVPFVIDAEYEALEPFTAKALYDFLQNGLAAHFQHRLGFMFSQLSQARSQSARVVHNFVS